MALTSTDISPAEWQLMWKNGNIQKYSLSKSRRKLQELYDHYIQGQESAKILVPMCGDSEDMKILADRGHEIIGIDCSPIGIKAFLNRHGVEYTNEPCPQIKGSIYRSKDNNYRFYCCDLFSFSSAVEGQFDVILDFGSKGGFRRSKFHLYTDIMKGLLKPNGRYVVEFFVYDLQKYPDSLPLYVTCEEMQLIYGHQYSVEILSEGSTPYIKETYPGEHMPEMAGVPISELGEAIYYLITPK